MCFSTARSEITRRPAMPLLERPAARAADLHRAVNRPDPVGEPPQPAGGLGTGAPAPVIGHPKPQQARNVHSLQRRVLRE
jgi:hypothetical protein